MRIMQLSLIGGCELAANLVIYHFHQPENLANGPILSGCGLPIRPKDNSTKRDNDNPIKFLLCKKIEIPQANEGQHHRYALLF